MKLLLKIKDESFVYETKANETVADVKVNAANTYNLSPLGIELYHQDVKLNDSDNFSQLEELSNVEVIVPILGGKVHGSLARAGKVKGQTPKVEKSEKRKKPRGRAKRRMQYSRRFTETVQIGGRRKGPNSNAK